MKTGLPHLVETSQKWLVCCIEWESKSGLYLVHLDMALTVLTATLKVVRLLEKAES